MIDQDMKLVSIETGIELHVGDIVKDFRGESVTLVSGYAPRHDSSTGRVEVTVPGNIYTRELFPSVVGAVWVRRDGTDFPTLDQLDAAFEGSQAS